MIDYIVGLATVPYTVTPVQVTAINCTQKMSHWYMYGHLVMEDSVGTVCWWVNLELIPQTLQSSQFGMLYGDLVSAKTRNKICHLCCLLYFHSNIMILSVVFTTILLIVNHFYLNFALPTVCKGSVAAGQSFNLTHSLVKHAEIPSDQKCRQPISIIHCTPQGGAKYRFHGWK